MSGEARLKLSVDASQAQQQIKIIDQQLNELGRGSSIGGSGRAGGSSDQYRGIDSTEVERLINAQERFLDSFNDYIASSKQNSQEMANKLDRIHESLRSTTVGKGSGSFSKEAAGNELKGILGKIATGATVSMAVKSLVGYASQGASSSASSELQAYNVFNTSDLYDGHYDTARNVQADIGSPYGYDVYSTLGVQSRLIGRTGVTSQENISLDTQSALRTARALSVDEGGLTDTFGRFYQTGTYGNGELSKFANLFSTSIQEAGMIGREDEQLEILESINSLLDKNLTTITESQYESALGLYSLFSSSNQALSGSAGANLVDNLNNAITSGDTTMDIALGKYSGRYSSLWEFEQQKEKGISDTQNLSSIIDYFENYAGLDLSSDTGKFALQKFLQSNSADLSTEEIDEIIKNIDSIRSGEYSNIFNQSVSGSKGSKYIDKQISDWDASKLSEMTTYEAESLNSQERIGDSLNEATSVLKDMYNNLPQWMQNGVSLGGSVLSGVGDLALGVGSAWIGNSIFSNGIKGTFGKIFGSGIGNNIPKGATEGFTDYAHKIVKAYESGDDVDELLKGLSKNGKVTDDLYDWADELSQAFGSGADDVADDLIKQGYKSFGKNLGKGVSSSVDDVMSGTGKGLIGSTDEVLSTIGNSSSSALKGAGKILGVAGTALEVGMTAYDTYKAVEDEDYRKAYSEVGGGVGSIAGGWAGAAGGAAAGAAIGSVVPIIGTGLGGIIGGVLGGIGGGNLGNFLGESAGELVYDSTNKKDIEESSSSIKNNTKALENNTEAIKSVYGNNGEYLGSYPSGSYVPFRPHAIGADYIPYDGYLAELHKGETVLDAHTASEYRNGTLGNNGFASMLEIKLSGSIDGMTRENQSRIVTAVVSQLKNQIGISNTMNQLAFNNVRVAN